MVLRVVVLFLLLIPTALAPQGDYWSLPSTVGRFVNSWNRCVAKLNDGVLDLKVCREANRRWQEVFKHEGWPK